MNTKPTNPKERFGIRKVSMSVVPATVLSEVAVGMTEGAVKYTPYNWREAGVRASVYYDATMRHLMRWWEREDIDPDSKLSHITKAICSLMVLRDGMIQGVMTDDRPDNNLILREFMEGLDDDTAELLDKKRPTVEPSSPKLGFIDKYLGSIHLVLPGITSTARQKTATILEHWPAGMHIEGNRGLFNVVVGSLLSNHGYAAKDFCHWNLTRDQAQTNDHYQDEMGWCWGIAYIHRDECEEKEVVGSQDNGYNIRVPDGTPIGSVIGPIMPTPGISAKPFAAITDTSVRCREQDVNGNCSKPNCSCWRE